MRRSPDFASRADDAIVIDRQSRLVNPGKSSVNTNSSSQSSAASLACSKPNNSVTALMNAPSSRSAMVINLANVRPSLFVSSYLGRQIFPTSKFSPPFWLTTQRHLLDKNGPTAEERLLPGLATSSLICPDRLGWGPFQGELSVSPLGVLVWLTVCRGMKHPDADTSFRPRRCGVDPSRHRHPPAISPISRFSPAFWLTTQRHLLTKNEPYCPRAASLRLGPHRPLTYSDWLAAPCKSEPLSVSAEPCTFG